MTFIRLKTETKRGKKYQSYYYCLRRRSRIKDGGNGKVKSPDKLIGDSLTIPKYLYFWLWDSIPVVDYIEAMIAFEIKQHKWLLPGLTWQIDWKFRKGKAIAGKLKFRSSPSIDPECPNIDARSKWPKALRECLQNRIDWVIEAQDSISNDIEDAAACLARHELFKQGKAKEQADYKQWKSDPYRQWEDIDGLWEYSKDYGDRCLETIETYQRYADMSMEHYQAAIAKLINHAPPGERKMFEAAIVRKTEKLAGDPNFLDRHNSK